MIEFNNGHFTATRDKFGWTLTEHFVGKDKDGNPKPQTRERYFSNISQVCHEVLDICAGNCSDAKEIIKLFTDAKKLLTNSIK